MPTILRLRLIPQEDIHLRLPNGPAQGWFLALAKEWDPAWADALHPPNKGRPTSPAPRLPRAYALAPLHHAARAPLAEQDTLDDSRLASGHVRRGEPLALRLSLADDERARRLLTALPSLSLPPLGGIPCRLARLPRAVEGDPDRLHASWAQLADALPARRLHLRFETPTFFSHQGEMRLLPEPARLWDGWRRAWLDLAPAMPLGSDTLTLDGLQIARYELHTEAVPLKGGLQRGFVGKMALEWRKGVPIETRRTAAALAGIADFTGTGAKTMLGLGQTRLTIEE